MTPITLPQDIDADALVRGVARTIYAEGTTRMSDIEMLSNADALLSQMEVRAEVLAPLVAEHARLTAAIAAMKGETVVGAQEPKRARAGRPRGSGKRGDEAIALLKQHGPLTIPQIAEHMGIQQNYLYRVMPGLAEDGKVLRKDDGTWVQVHA